MMSHELRTPLNAIIGFSDVLRLELFGPRDLPVYKDYADNIHHSGRHLLELVNQILDVSRVEAGKIDLRMENLPLPTALTDVLQIEGGAILKKALRVHLGDGQELSVRADGQSLRQLLLNVVDNAVKYSPTGGTIEIGARQTNGRVTVSVGGRRAGRPAGQARPARPAVRQLRRSRDGQFQAEHRPRPLISRALAEAMDGEIRFDNRPERGFKVEITLPAAGR